MAGEAAPVLDKRRLISEFVVSLTSEKGKLAWQLEKMGNGYRTFP